jgi:peptide deformylase
MKGLKDILLLGDPRLYQKCTDVDLSELPEVQSWVADLHNAMQEIRARYNFGRGIAAPQLGIMKRLIYINVDKPLIIINPRLEFKSQEMFELWDDCMSLPNLLVRVKRHQKVVMHYRDENWVAKTMEATGSMSELLQHELDHLDGILCTMRAIDDKSLKWRNVNG